MGQDPYTGKDYSHRRGWVLERLQLLVASFAIDVGFFATLSNHLHLVLRTSPRLVRRWGDQEVARRWLRIYSGRRNLDRPPPEPTDAQVEALARDKARIRKLRRRLANISWFMAALSEFIARRANHEDNVTGRFWQGRFSCREITSEGGLLVCGSYVDLNQVRAGEAFTPSESWSSSIACRLRAQEGGDSWLAPLTLSDDDLGDRPCDTGQRASDKGMLPITLDEYLQLLEWTVELTSGQSQQPMGPQTAALLERLSIVPQQWLEAVDQFADLFFRVVGTAAQLVERAGQAGRKCFHGVRAAAQVFR